MVRGDLTNLRCDAWLLPSDQEMTGLDRWWPDLVRATGLEEEDGDLYLTKAVDEIEKPLTCAELKGIARDNQGSPWLTDVAIDSGAGERQAELGVLAFIRSVETSVEPSGDRLRVAIPAVGTRAGGWSDTKGQRLKDLISAVADEIERDGGPDVVLVLRTDEVFAAAQYARKLVYEAREESIWPELAVSSQGPDGSDQMRVSLEQLAKEIADKAVKDELVVFLGAGVSRSAGLPGWGELLDDLAQDVGVDASTDFERMSPLDRAWLIERRIDRLDSEAGGSLGERVSEKFPRNQAPSLAHQLLASMPVNEIVTTNYDLLFEDAAKAAGCPASLITDVAPEGGKRWLLKLHGSADRPADIVLSRNDYLNYSSKKAALAGVVQAMLLTRHMLFVGFSLSDDNFLKIAHDVRNAIGERPDKAQPAGTALMVNSSEALSDLWSDLIDTRSVDSAGEIGRGLEIFLDAVLAHAVTGEMSYLFDETFDDLLSNGDLKVREALFAASSSIDKNESSDALRLFQAFLRSLGYEPPNS